jgi:hypothetical protein
MTAAAQLDFQEQGTGSEVSEAQPGKNGLINLVLEAVESVDWPGKRSEFVCAEQSFPSKTLMAVLTYSYATRVYGSQEVEDHVQREGALRHLASGECPSFKVLRRYRKLHRDALKQCLVYVFSRAACIRFPDENLEMAPVDHVVAVALNEWFEPLVVPLPPREAEERLNRACFVDGMLMVD